MKTCVQCKKEFEPTSHSNTLCSQECIRLRKNQKLREYRVRHKHFKTRIGRCIRCRTKTTKSKLKKYCKTCAKEVQIERICKLEKERNDNFKSLPPESQIELMLQYTQKLLNGDSR